MFQFLLWWKSNFAVWLIGFEQEAVTFKRCDWLFICMVVKVLIESEFFTK